MQVCQLHVCDPLLFTSRAFTPTCYTCMLLQSKRPTAMELTACHLWPAGFAYKQVYAYAHIFIKISCASASAIQILHIAVTML